MTGSPVLAYVGASIIATGGMFGLGSFTTLVLTVELSRWPRLSYTVSLTVYEPVPEYVWLIRLPLAWLPSPRSHS